MVSTYTLGETLAWAISVTDSDGAAADPGTGPTATVTLPDGTTSAATVTSATTGSFTATLVSTQAGRHLVTWTASGANSAAFPFVQTATVVAVDDRRIISLDDARAALNIAATDRTHDEEILDYIRAATVVIEDIAGKQVSDTITETHSGMGRTGINLYHHPTAVTSVTEDGTALSATDYDLDTVSGVLWRGSQPGAAVWSSASASNVVVVYTVGSGVIAANVALAARELVRHLYAIGQQPWRTPYGGGLDDVMMTTTPNGYAVPNRVVELLRPSMAGRMPGFA